MKNQEKILQMQKEAKEEYKLANNADAKRNIGKKPMIINCAIDWESEFERLQNYLLIALGIMTDEQIMRYKKEIEENL